MGLANQRSDGLRGVFEAVLLSDRHIDELAAAGDKRSKREAAVVDMGDLMCSSSILASGALLVNEPLESAPRILCFV
ncbi:hypothetical protein HFO89_33760 [Rhizobium leguminosarum]|nr:hypothetical protein [Rhizobium leguminosarum]MBY5461231.1 hypothetical protein [Rhizobium leguminosarum]